MTGTKESLLRGYVHAVEPQAWSRYAIESLALELDDDEVPGDEEDSQVTGRVAVMNVSGACYYKTGIKKEWLRYFYALEWAHVLEDLEELVQDPRISSIVLDMDSPGGAVFGTPEAAGRMRELAQTKRIIVYANPGVFSAAYWVASQATEVHVLPSGYVGSIGTLIIHQDFSGYYSEMGITTSVIKVPERKAETNYLEPLSDGARKRLEDDAERIYAQFVADVAIGRRVDEMYVKENFGKGGILNADTALSVGAVDGIGTLEEVVAAELDRASSPTAGKANAVNLTNLNKVRLELAL